MLWMHRSPASVSNSLGGISISENPGSRGNSTFKLFCRNMLFTMAAPFYTSTNNIQGLRFRYILTNTWDISFLFKAAKTLSRVCMPYVFCLSINGWWINNLWGWQLLKQWLSVLGIVCTPFAELPDESAGYRSRSVLCKSPNPDRGLFSAQCALVTFTILQRALLLELLTKQVPQPLRKMRPVFSWDRFVGDEVCLSRQVLWAAEEVPLGPLYLSG